MMSDVLEKFKLALENEYPETDGNIVILALAYYIYKAKKRDWIERELGYKLDGLDADHKEVVAKFWLHNTSDADISEMLNSAQTYWNNWVKLEFDRMLEERRVGLTSYLIADIEKNLETKIIAEVKTNTKKTTALYINVASSIIGPLLLIGAVSLIAFIYPEYAWFAKLGADARNRVEQGETEKQKPKVKSVQQNKIKKTEPQKDT